LLITISDFRFVKSPLIFIPLCILGLPLFSSKFFVMSPLRFGVAYFFISGLCFEALVFEVASFFIGGLCFEPLAFWVASFSSNNYNYL
jgi:hypothetical protein